VFLYKPADHVTCGGVRRAVVTPGEARPMSNRLSKRTAADTVHPLDWMGTDGLFTPQGYEPGYDYPLVVWLPDRAGRFDIGRAMKRLSLRNYVAIAPDFDPRAGHEPLWEAIERIRDRASIHPQRIYLVGQGSGGTEAFRIGCRHPEAFAGVVSLGGAFPLDEGLFARLADVRRLPMLLCCQRSVCPEATCLTDRTLRVFHAAGAMLALRIYPDSKPLSKAILTDVNRWLMDEVCGTSALVPSPAAS
jgi:phospholipase/carboxylesterase